MAVSDIMTPTDPDVFVRISQDQLASRPVIGQPSLYGSRVEMLNITWANANLAVANGETFGLYLPIPKGEVWAALAARFHPTVNPATPAVSNGAIWLKRRRVWGNITNPPQIDWNGAYQDFFIRASGYDSDVAVTNLINLEWHSYQGGAAGQNISLPIWEGNEEVLFMFENTSGAGITVLSPQIMILYNRIPLGSTLLQELRNNAISDLELQRLLQATAVAGIPSMPVNV
jgi:hypothetical protein